MIVFNPTILDVLFNILLFLLLLYGYGNLYKGNISKLRAKHQDNYFSWVLLLLSVFAICDYDYYSYKAIYENYIKSGEMNNLEPIYFWLAGISPYYLIWRIIVWGSALILMNLTIKRLKVNIWVTWIFIGLFYALSFFKLRNVLGFSFMFYGASLILTANRRTRMYIGGMAFIVSSYFLHASMLMSLAFLAIAFLPIKRKIIIISLFIWPFLSSVVTGILSGSIVDVLPSLADNKLFMSRAISYTSVEGKERTLVGIISDLFTYTSLYLPLLWSLYQVYLKKLTIPNEISFFLKFWYISFYFASLFAFQEVSFWIFIRSLTMGYFPMCITLGYLYVNTRRSRIKKLILCMGLISLLFTLFHKIYILN